MLKQHHHKDNKYPRLIYIQVHKKDIYYHSKYTKYRKNEFNHKSYIKLLKIKSILTHN